MAGAATGVMGGGDGTRGDPLLLLLEGLAALPTGNLATALTAACGHVAVAFGADKVDAFLLDPGAATLVALGTSDTPMGRDQRALGLHILPLANGGRTARVFATGEPWRDGRVDADSGELLGIREALGVRSTLAVPLVVGGARRGVLQASDARPDRFATDDLRRLTLVARWVGFVAEREEAAGADASTARLAAVAHELRTPLNTLQLALDLLAASATAATNLADRDLLDMARRNARRLLILVEDLLAVGQLDAGLLGVRRAPLDLRDVVAEAAAALRLLLDEKGQTLAIDLPAPLPVAGDARRLGQVVTNLLANAHRHTPAGTRVAITGYADDAEVRLVVADDGPGVPAAERGRVFARDHAAGAGGGAGLGLAIAREIAALHGGRLWVEEAPGGGAAFHLALPRAPAAP